MVALVGSGQAGIFVGVGLPVKVPRINDGAPHRRGMAIQILGGGVDDDVRPPLKGPAAPGGGEGVVHDERHPVGVGGSGKALQIQHRQGGVGQGLAKQGLGVGLEGGVQLLRRAVRVHKGELDAHALHGHGKQVVGAPVEGRGTHHMVTRAGQIEDGEEGGSLP